MKNNVMKVVVIKGNGRTWGMGSFDCPGELALENDKILGINTLAKITLKEVEISYGCPKRWRRKRQPSPVLLPRKSHGWRSLVSLASQRVGHDWATSLSIFFFKPLGKFPKFLSGNTVCQGLYSPQHYKINFFLSHDLWHSAILLAFRSILIFSPNCLLMSVRIQSDFVSDKRNTSPFEKLFSAICLGTLTIYFNISLA